MSQLLSITLVGLLAAVSASTAPAEMLGPGTYHGYYDVTRWGEKVFFYGPYTLFVDDSAAAQLERFRRQPLKIQATEVSQPINPGGMMIRKIGKVTVLGTTEALTLSATPVASRVTAGAGLNLHLSITNRSDNAAPIPLQSLAIILVTDSPGTKRPLDFVDPENRAFWYYLTTYTDPGWEKRTKPLSLGCREIHPPWTADILIQQGHGIHRTELRPGTAGPLAIEPRGAFATDFVVGKELPPGKYEAFFCSVTGNFSSVAGPMSARVPFEVVAANATPEAPPAHR